MVMIDMLISSHYHLVLLPIYLWHRLVHLHASSIYMIHGTHYLTCICSLFMTIFIPCMCSSLYQMSWLILLSPAVIMHCFGCIACLLESGSPVTFGWWLLCCFVLQSDCRSVASIARRSIIRCCLAHLFPEVEHLSFISSCIYFTLSASRFDVRVL
jgi:hypothetical protein